jgi:hypothetical protein
MVQSAQKTNCNAGVAHRLGRTVLELGAGGLTLVLLTGCPLVENIPPTNDFAVDNNTEVDLVVTIPDVPDWADGTQSHSVDAGLLVFFSWEASLGDCYGTGAVATDPGGTEVARLDHPVCDGDKWIFEEDGGIVLEQAPR